MTGISRRDAIRARGAMLLVGAVLCCVSLAGAMRWITIDRTGNLVLGTTMLVFVGVCWFVGRRLAKHASA